MNYSALSSFCSSLISRGFSSWVVTLPIAFSNNDLLNKFILSAIRFINIIIINKEKIKVLIGNGLVLLENKNLWF